jgi:hypothetical protein
LEVIWCASQRRCPLTIAGPNSAEAGKANGRRRDWLIAHANSAIIVWNGQDRTIGAVWGS